MMTDIEIAQKAEMKHIREVAAKLPGYPDQSAWTG